MKKKKEKLNIDKTNVAKLTGMNKIRGGGDPSHNTSYNEQNRYHCGTVLFFI